MLFKVCHNLPVNPQTEGKWCSSGDSNPEGLAATSTSSWRVYQFHHPSPENEGAEHNGSPCEGQADISTHCGVEVVDARGLEPRTR